MMLDITKLRANLNMNQEELATKLGITRQYVSMIETGANEPSMILIMKMANLVNLDLKGFINEYSK